MFFGLSGSELSELSSSWLRAFALRLSGLVVRVGIRLGLVLPLAFFLFPSHLARTKHALGRL